MKRFLALVLALVMTAGIIPAAHAVGSYDDVQEYENGLARVWRDGKCGAIDASGREVAPPIYDWVWLYEENYIHVEKKVSEDETLRGLLDREGNVLLPVEYEGIGALNDGRRQVGLNGKEGYMDEDQQWVIPAIYDRAWPFVAGLAWVEMTKEDWGYIGGVIDREGREVLPCVYDDVNIHDNGVISAGQYTGETGRFGGKVKKYGLFDQAGNMLLPMEYDWITCYNVAWGDEDHRLYDDYFELQKETPEGGSLSGIADRKGNIVLPVEYGYILRPDAERWLVERDDLWGVLDKAFQVVIPLQYEYMWDYEDSYLVTTGDGKWGAVGLAGETLIPMEYDMIEYYEGKSLCVVEENGKHGVLTYPQGEVVVPLIYDELTPQYNSDLAIVMKDGQYGVIDYTTGAVVVPMAFDGVATDVYNLNDSILVIKNQLFGAYDKQGNELFVCQFPTEERLRGAILSGSADPSMVEGGSQKAGVEVTWYPGTAYIIRRYGTDRMLLVKDNKSGLFGLDGTQYTDYVFDAVEEFDANGQAIAAQNGKWGKIDLDGNTVLDFTCDSQQEAELGIKFVGRWGKNDPPFALFTSAGKRLTGYDFWAVGDFVNGFARVTDGNAYAYLDTQGRRITDFVYSWLSCGFEEDGYASVHTYEDGYNVIDREGKPCLPVWTSRFARKPWRAGFGIWGYESKDGLGFVELSTGRVVSEPRFVDAFTTKGGTTGYRFNANGLMSVVLRDGDELKYYLMDTQGELTAVERDGEAGLPIDPATGETYQPSSGPKPWLDEETKEPVQVYYEGLRKMGRWDVLQPSGEGHYGFASEAGEVAVPLLYDDVGDFDHGYASVRLNGVYGLLKNPLLKHKTSEWATEEVNAATEAGYVTESCQEYQTFTITRSQFASLAVNYLEKQTGEAIAPAPADTFTDTADEAVLKAYAAGIVQGTGEGKFSPGGILTREQLATMLWRAMSKAGVRAFPTDLSAYADADQVDHWARDSVTALAGLGVMEGTGGGLLSPKDSCTVEQAILLVYRAAK